MKEVTADLKSPKRLQNSSEVDYILPAAAVHNTLDS